MSKNNGKNLSDKCSQKLLDHAKQSPGMHLKMFQKWNSKTGEVYGNSSGNKVSDKSTKVCRTLS